ncbi:EndoU domain-containing protein [Arsenicicoccus piscis]|uniref:Putative T7SS secretion signal domain-containing protein n=1 Tax=Arsenicicoccus piscis TaxID=673954 RepID=A0ABQ6HKG8_9MICO|nr:EndoU domain-containing protein [Arsenicicoccus piscis]MCH8627136.1 EndoU domain-containing protein [Arsenicicoccus piscis]GMA18910.1 hypothetical protein GCM10025862_09310 [Arsenicicoccus piscis]
MLTFAAPPAAGAVPLLGTGAPAALQGDPAAVVALAGRWRQVAVALVHAAQSVARVSTPSWDGPASVAAGTGLDALGPGLAGAAQLLGAAADALTRHAAVLESAQQDTRRAVALHEDGVQATAHAAATLDASHPDGLRLLTGAQELALSAAHDGALSTFPFATDPGAPMRAAAAALAGEAAARAARSAAETAATLLGLASVAPRAPRLPEVPTVADGFGQVLDAAGLVPVVGNVADLANLPLQLGQGRTADAVITAVGLLPGLGDAVQGSRQGARVLEREAGDWMPSPEQLQDLSPAGSAGFDPVTRKVAHLPFPKVQRAAARVEIAERWGQLWREGAFLRVNPSRERHIRDGELRRGRDGQPDWSGGHCPPPRPKKSLFPAEWCAGDLMGAVEALTLSPDASWTWASTLRGRDRFRVEGRLDGRLVRVVVEPAGEGIITAHPLEVIPSTGRRRTTPRVVSAP